MPPPAAESLFGRPVELYRGGADPAAAPLLGFVVAARDAPPPAEGEPAPSGPEADVFYLDPATGTVRYETGVRAGSSDRGGFHWIELGDPGRAGDRAKARDRARADADAAHRKAVDEAQARLRAASDRRGDRPQDRPGNPAGPAPLPVSGGLVPAPQPAAESVMVDASTAPSDELTPSGGPPGATPNEAAPPGGQAAPRPVPAPAPLAPGETTAPPGSPAAPPHPSDQPPPPPAPPASDQTPPPEAKVFA